MRIRRIVTERSFPTLSTVYMPDGEHGEIIKSERYTGPVEKEIESVEVRTVVYELPAGEYTVFFDEDNCMFHLYFTSEKETYLVLSSHSTLRVANFLSCNLEISKKEIIEQLIDLERTKAIAPETSKKIIEKLDAMEFISGAENKR